MPQMSGVALTIDEVRDLRDAYKAAYKAFAVGGQSYTIDGRVFNRGQLAEVRAEFYRLDAQLTAMEAGRPPGARMVSVMPRDT